MSLIVVNNVLTLSIQVSWLIVIIIIVVILSLLNRRKGGKQGKTHMNVTHLGPYAPLGIIIGMFVMMILMIFLLWRGRK